MSIRNLLLFLVGNRQAILELAADRRCLVVGFLFVLSAGFAREYDGTDLQSEPFHLVIPIGASLAASILLFSLACGKVFVTREGRPHAGQAYLSFLTLFWMTAPLAWLYAIPYERFLSPGDATSMNLWTLAFVAAWRVLLMIRVISVLTEMTLIESGFLVMMFADILAMIAVYFMPKPVISFMGGVRQSESDRIITSTTFLIGCLGMISAPVWIIGAFIVLTVSKPEWILLNEKLPSRKSGRDLWFLAVASVLIWFVILPFTQSEFRRTTSVERAMKESRIAEGLDLMSAHARKDFPPQWDPPPRLGYGEVTPNILDVMELVSQRNDATWVREIYISKLLQSLEAEIGGYYRLTSNSGDLVRLAKCLAAMPEGPAVASKLSQAIQELQDSKSSLYEDEKASLKTLAELAVKGSPKPKEN